MPSFERRVALRAGVAAGGTLAAAFLARKWVDDTGGITAPPPGTPPNQPPDRAAATEPLLAVADALAPVRPPVPFPPLVVRQPGRTPVPLRTLFGARGTVVNLWATWCGPCRAEMPSLATLAGALASDGIDVLPVALDGDNGATAGRAEAGFLAERGASALPVLLADPAAVMGALGLAAIPLTVLVGADGRERARLAGGADWATARSIARVRDALR